MNNIERINVLLRLIESAAIISLVIFTIIGIILFFVEWKKYCEKAADRIYDIRIIIKNIEDKLYNSDEEDNK